MDTVIEDPPIISAEIVDLSNIKTPLIRNFISDQLHALEWIKDKDAFSGLPTVNFNFYFSSHGSVEDIRGQKKHISESDIWIPEMINWNEDVKRVYQSVSEGTVRPQEALDAVRYPSGTTYNTRSEQLSYLYGRKIPVEFVDINSLENAQFKPLGKMPIRDSFQETLVDVKQWLQYYGEIQIMRDFLMLSRLRDQILNAIGSRPDLKSKDHISVLLTLGSSHTWLYQTLQRYGFNVQKDFSVSPQLYGFEAESVRNIRYGKTLNNELIANVIFGHLIKTFLPEDKNANDDNDRIIPFLRRACSAFSIEEKASIYDEILAGTHDRRLIQQKITDKLNEKGIQYEV